MTERLLPFRGIEPPLRTDEPWENALFVADTQAEIDAALAMKRKASAQPLEFGEDDGHPFRGNQYTGGFGSGRDSDRQDGTSAFPFKTADVNEAAELIAQGLYVQLPPTSVSILLDKLAETNDPTRTYDLCKISVPDTNLFCVENQGIPRVDMPQLSTKNPVDGSPASFLPKNERGEVEIVTAFKAQLQSDGFKFKDVSVPAAHLKATQNELNGGKVAGMEKAIESGKLPPGRVFVSSDNYVLDGHHRWAANVAFDYGDNKLGDIAMDVTRVDLPISVLVDYAKSFARYMGVPQAGVAASARLDIELGEDVGHEFRGNQWTGPIFGGTAQEPISKLAEGKAAYAVSAGLPHPSDKNWAKIQADPQRGQRIASDYSKLPLRSQEAIPAYNSLRSEVSRQYDYLTKTLGVKVETVDHDPYRNVAELQRDIKENNHLAVMATDVTGPHPYFSNAENDMFRAVHDAFGHAAIGRGFDRNGEEAAFQSHAQMFTPLATRALATETRGQNSELIYGDNKGEFPPQKLALLPEEDALVAAALLAAAALDADEDNLYHVTKSHHVSLGRSLHRQQVVGAIEFGDIDGHPFHGNQYTGGTGVAERVREEGGMTFDPHTGSEPKDGFIVAKAGIPSTFVATDTFLHDDEAALDALDRFVMEHVDEYDDPAAMIGIWHDDHPEHDEIVLDVVEKFDGKDEAVQAGIDRNQQAIYDVVGKDVIDTGGTGRP